MRSSAPPFIAPCYFGTDIPDKENLIACNYSPEEIRAMIGADSLGFLSLDALHQIAPDAACGFCDGCLYRGNIPSTFSGSRSAPNGRQRVVLPKANLAQAEFTSAEQVFSPAQRNIAGKFCGGRFTGKYPIEAWRSRSARRMNRALTQGRRACALRHGSVQMTKLLRLQPACAKVA